jgi:zinc ribbon protein
MFILFGFRRRSSRLGVIFVMCGNCHTPAAHALIRIRRYFTLFFVPVIPIGTKYQITCTMCGRATQISKEAAETYASAANQNSAASSGTATPDPAYPSAQAMSSTSQPTKDESGVIYCSWCGKQRAVNAQSIHHCGSMERPVAFCMSCGTSFEEGATACTSCGTLATQVSR